MPSFKQMIALLFVLLLAACDQSARVPISSTAIVGTKAIIKAHRDEMIGEITDVTGKFVTMEFSNWEGDRLFTRNYYRGLFPVGGTEMNGEAWELEFDETRLESLFPLEPGKEVAFQGQAVTIDEGKTVDMWAQLQVVGEKTLSMPSGQRKVFLIESTYEFRFGDTTRLRTEFLYYDPEYSLVLKRVQRERGGQTFWRVVKVERPGNVGNSIPRQRRSGTVMI